MCSVSPPLAVAVFLPRDRRQKGSQNLLAMTRPPLRSTYACCRCREGRLTVELAAEQLARLQGGGYGGI